MAIPPLPPLRVKEADGSPNVIPVFQITMSNATVINEGGGKITIDAGGSQGPAGPAGTLTIGSSITGGASAGYVLYVSGAVLGQINSGYFVNTSRTISTIYPVSGGGNLGVDRTFAIDTAFLINSGRTISTTYPLSGGGNLASDRTFFIQTGQTGQILITSGGVAGDIAWVNSSGGASGAVYAPTGGFYVTWSADTLLSSEKILTASDNIVVTTGANNIWVSATTSNISGKQDSITFPLVTGSGGTGRSTIGSAHTLLGVNSSEATLSYYALLASDNATIVKSGTGIFISAITNAGGSTSTAGLVQSSRTISTLYPLSGGGNLGLDRTFAVDTAFLVNTGRTLSAGSGLSGGGDLSADRSFSVNTNVRDKSFGFFFAGSLSTVALASSAMFYVPFNMELREVRMAVSNSAGGQNIMIQPRMWNASLTASTGLFAANDRPQIVTNNLVGSNGTLGFTSLHAGSWVGVQIDSVGTTVVASNLTVNFILRTS